MGATLLLLLKSFLLFAAYKLLLVLTQVCLYVFPLKEAFILWLEVGIYECACDISTPCRGRIA